MAGHGGCVRRRLSDRSMTRSAGISSGATRVTAVPLLRIEIAWNGTSVRKIAVELRSGSLTELFFSVAGKLAEPLSQC